MGKIRIAVLSAVLCITAPVAAISGAPSPVGDHTISVIAETACVGYVLAETYFINRWIDANDGDSGAQLVGTATVVLPDGTTAQVPVSAPASDLGGPGRASVLGAEDTASEIRYQEEFNAIYGTTQYIKQFDASTGNAPDLDVDTNITFVASPQGGRLTASERVGSTVVANGYDDKPSGTYDLAGLCPWLQDPDPASDGIPAYTEAAAMGSHMSVGIVQAATAATVDATGGTPNVSYGIVAAGPAATGGYGVGTITAEINTVVQKGADKVGWTPDEPVYVGPENPTAEQLSDPNNYKVEAKLAAPSLIEYQEYQDSLTSSGVWTFAKAMSYLSKKP